MSLQIKYEKIFTCPELECKFKTKKFETISALNMHLSKTHKIDLKIKLDFSGRAYYRRK